MATSDKDDPLLPKLAGAAIAKYIGLISRTATKLTDPKDFPATIRDNHPVIVAVWHGQFMLIPELNAAEVPTRILVARHGDAEIIGQAFAHSGWDLIRGAGAGSRQRDRGGAQALRLAVRALRDGHTIGMTADVPPGPARKVGLGIITLARMSGRPIVPAALATRRYFSFKTWSRFTVNLPFCKMGLVLGDPILVPRDASPDDLEALRLKTEISLNEATKRAYHLAGGNPARSTPPRGAMMPEGDKAVSGLALKAYGGLTKLVRPLAPFFLSYRERRNKEDAGRRQERYGIASRPRPAGPLVWLHAASVGELNSILPLIDALNEKRPDLKTLVTTGTVTSATLASDRLGANSIHQYVPLDAPQFVDNFLQHWRPDLAAFTESEIWPNLILESARQKIPLVLINGRMSQKSFTKWRRNAAMATPLFGRFQLVLAQNDKFSRRFSDLGARHCIAVGNLKIDAPAPPADEKLLAELRAGAGKRRVFIAASTHDGEDEIIAEAHDILAKKGGNPLTLIAPRHPERADAIFDMLSARGLKVARRAKGDDIAADTAIYLADTIGEMGTLYKLASVAFLGGSLVEHGGQNPIEAIRCGTVVLTGRHWRNFRDEYKALIQHKAVSEVSTAAELAKCIDRLFKDDAELARRRKAASAALENLSGALRRTVDEILPLLPDDDDEEGDSSGQQDKKDLMRAS